MTNSQGKRQKQKKDSATPTIYILELTNKHFK